LSFQVSVEVWVDVLLWKFWVLHTFCVGDSKNKIYVEKSIVLHLFTCRCTETESEKSTKCFPSSESTGSLSSETSISCQPIQQRSTCMIQVFKDLSMKINDFHEKLIILLKNIWHYSFIKRHGHS
jgi:hypothetical protein